MYFVGEERSQSRYTGAQAEAVWRVFSDPAQGWDVPEPVHHAPAGARSTACQT